MFYYLGLVLVLLSWLCGAYLLIHWHDRDFLTISKHAASTNTSYWLFMSVLVGAGGLFFAWALTYIVPKTIDAFAILLTISFALQLGTAIIPDRPGWKRTVHCYCAWGMAVSWMPLVITAAISPSLSAASRITCLVIAGYMVTMFGVFLSRRAKNYFLLLQGLYVVALELALLAAAYL